jgi:hypothetical protein
MFTSTSVSVRGIQYRNFFLFLNFILALINIYRTVSILSFSIFLTVYLFLNFKQ